MKIRYDAALYITGLFSLLLIFSACSDDPAGTSEIPETPEFPSFEAADLTAESLQVSGIPPDTAQTRTAFAGARPFMDQTVIFFTSLSGNRVLFELAAETDAIFEDESFIWTVEVNSFSEIFGTSFSYNVVADLSGDQVEWRVESDASGLLPPDLIPDGLAEQKIEWIRGFTSDDGSRGEWNIFGPFAGTAAFTGSSFFNFFGSSLDDILRERSDRLREFLDDDSLDENPLLLFEDARFFWEKVSETEKTLIFSARNITDDSEVTWKFERNGNTLRFELDNTLGDGNNILIQLDLESGEGFIDRNGDRKCWDTNHENTECF